MDFFPFPSNRSMRVLSWIPLSPFNSVVFDSHVGRVSLLVQVQANLQRASSELFFTRWDHDGAWWNSIVRVVKYAASFGTREKMRDEYYLLLVAPSRWIKSIWAIFKNIFKRTKERKEFKREFLFVCFFFSFFRSLRLFQMWLHLNERETKRVPSVFLKAVPRYRLARNDTGPRHRRIIKKIFGEKTA